MFQKLIHDCRSLTTILRSRDISTPVASVMSILVSQSIDPYFAVIMRHTKSTWRMDFDDGDGLQEVEELFIAATPPGDVLTWSSVKSFFRYIRMTRDPH